MQADPSNAAPPKRKRRWFQFSLRTLLIGVTLLAIGSGWMARRIERKRREREAVAAIEKLGGRVKYDYMFAGEKPAGPDWLRSWFGENLFNEIEYVDLMYAEVTDAGLENVKEFSKLTSLWVVGTKVTDDGLVNLKGLTQLQVLVVMNARTSDAGLDNLKGLTQLRRLVLNNVNGPGLENLKGLMQLQLLSLVGTKIRDSGVENLKQLPQLKTLDLRGISVTSAAVNELQRALPTCKILYTESSRPRGVIRTHASRPSDSIDGLDPPEARRVKLRLAVA